MKVAFFIILYIFFVFSFSTNSAEAHSDHHVRKVCGKSAAKNIMTLCPQTHENYADICINGEVPSFTEYCSMGFSDSQIKFMCCPDQDFNLH
uniref:SVWC domain-containing protein n=1 Tax=Caenorhabditis tropicalis TaxID=1561998 RepID=A0A1I7TNP6_9PELO